MSGLGRIVIGVFFRVAINVATGINEGRWLTFVVWGLALVCCNGLG